MFPEIEPFTNHVFPMNDLFPHNTNSAECSCHPKVTNVMAYDVVVGQLIIHNSYDRREVYEHLERLWPTYEGFSYYE